MEAPTAQSLLTVGGLSVVVFIVCELIWRTANVAGATKERIGPLVAVIVGIVLSVLAGVVTGTAGNGEAYLNLVLAGLFVGATGMGIHDVVSSASPGTT